MKKMEIGRSGIQASILTLGAMGIGGGSRFSGTDDQESIRAIHAALDAGINLIDTAPVYGFGHSEEIVGKAIAGRRDKVILSTKCGLWWDDDEGSYRFTWDGHAVKRNVSRRTIRIEIEKSLKRLGTDYIDIYYTHNPACEPFMTPIEETIDTLMELKKEGKIRAIGASNCEISHIKSYLELGDISIVQRRFNMLERGVEKEILPFCKEHHLSLHAYSPVAKGLLSGNIGRDYQIPAGDSRESDAWWSPERLPLVLDFVDGLRETVCPVYNCEPVHLAVAYLRAKGENINVICGIRKERHLRENIYAAELELSQDAVAEIDRQIDVLQKRIAERNP